MDSWPAGLQGKARLPFRSGSPRGKLPGLSALPHRRVLLAANPNRTVLASRVGYATDDWQAGARHLQADIEQHMKLTKAFFERTFGPL